MQLFHIEPGLVIWTWITFGIVLLVLTKYVFPVLLHNIRQREADIARIAENTAASQARLQEMETLRQDIINRARREADGITHTAREDAEELRRTINQRAETEAAALLEAAERKIEEERIAALHRLRGEMAETVCQAAEKVVARSFLDESDRAYSRELLGQL